GEHATSDISITQTNSTLNQPLTITKRQDGIHYRDIETLQLWLSENEDDLTVTNTHTGVTNIDTNNGNDTVTITTSTGTLYVNTDQGQDQVTIDNIAGFTTIDTGANNDAITVRTTDGKLKINGQSGTDVIRIGTTTPSINGLTDSINEPIIVRGSDLVGGEDGFDQLFLGDALDTQDNIGAMTRNTINGLGMSSNLDTDNGFNASIAYHDLDDVQIYLGTGSDTFTIHSTHTGNTTIDSNSGDDKVYVDTIDGATEVITQDDYDTVTVGRATTGLLTQGTLDEINGGLLQLNLGSPNTIETTNSLTIPSGLIDGEKWTTTFTANVNTIDNRAYDTIVTTNMTRAQLASEIAATINNSSATDRNGREHVATRVATASGITVSITYDSHSSGADQLTVLRDGVSVAVNTPLVRRDTIVIADGANTDDNSIQITYDTETLPSRITSTEMTVGIRYVDAQHMDVHLGTGNDTVFIDTAQDNTTLTLVTGDEPSLPNATNDIVNISRINTDTIVQTGQGNDLIRVNFDQNGQQTNQSGIDAVVTLQGQNGSDQYEVGLAGNANATINVYDGSNLIDLGIDKLTLFGTNADEFFLLRAYRDDVLNIASGMVLAYQVDESLNPTDNSKIERVNYDDNIEGSIAIHGREGDDTFILDDNLLATTIYGDAGNDTFQIAQVFKSPRDEINPYHGLNVTEYLETLQTTRGFLTNGISQNTSIYGGIGNDVFTVYNNKAELYLFGEDDDDSFLIRLFVLVDPNDPKAPYTNINGGQGADFIARPETALVNIDGGDGYDTLVLVGTEMSEDFVITNDGIFGGGRAIHYSGLEKIVIDAQEGNDSFYIDSTSENVALEVVGGRGSDSFYIGDSGSDEPITVQSTSLEGHSGLIVHKVSSLDTRYDGQRTSGISAKVYDNDEAGILIRTNGQLRAFEGGASSSELVNLVYSIMLTRSPVDTVQVRAIPDALRESITRAGGKGLRLRRKGNTEYTEDGVTLLFDRQNWFTPQEIEIEVQEDFVDQGRHDLNIKHTVREGNTADSGGAYNDLTLPSVTVDVIDNDSANVVIIQSDSNTNVIEESTTDSYQVVLSRQPTGEVVISATETSNQLSVSPTTLTFTTANWAAPQTVTVTAGIDENTEGLHHATINYTITSNENDFYGITSSDILKGILTAVTADGANLFEADYDNVTEVITITSDQAFSATFEEHSGNFAIQSVSSTSAYEGTTEFNLATHDGTTTDATEVNVGTNWNLNLQGNQYSITIEDETNDTLEFAETSLVNLINSINLDLSGTVEIGQTWEVVVDDTTFKYDTVDNDENGSEDNNVETIADVVTQLVTLIDNNSAYTASGNGVRININSDNCAEATASVNSIETDNATSAFNAIRTGTNDIAVSRCSTTAPFTFTDDYDAGVSTTGQIAVDPGMSNYWSTVSFKLIGVTDIEVGDTWTVNLGGQPFTFATAATQTTTNAAANIANELNAIADYVAMSKDEEIIVVKLTTDVFTSAVSPPDTKTVDIFDLANAATSSFTVSAPVDNSDYVAAGIVWKINIGTNLPYTYTSSATDTLSDVATELANTLNDVTNIVAATMDSELVITQMGTTSETITATATEPAELITNDTSQYKTRKIVLTGTAAVGDSWTVSVGGTNYDYTVGENNESNTVEQIDVTIFDNDAPLVVFEESDGDTSVVEPTDSIPIGTGSALGVHPEFDVHFDQTTRIESSVTTAGGGEANGSIDIIPTLTSQSQDQLTQATIVLSGYVQTGSIWTITVVDDDNSPLTATFTAQTGDDLETIQASLLNSLNASQYVEAFEPTTYVVIEHPASSSVVSTAPQTERFLIQNLSDTTTKIALNGSYTTDDIWTLKLINTAGSPSTRTYNFTSSQASVELSTIATHFESLVNNDNSDSNSGNQATDVSAKVISKYVRIRGDFGASVIDETGQHATYTTATNLDSGKWNTNVNSDISQSTTRPHITFNGTGDGQNDFFKFEITSSMLSAGGGSVTGTFDMDHGFEFRDRLFWANRLTLYSSNGGNKPTTLKNGRGYSRPTTGAGGSQTWFDDYLEYTFTQTGEYIIEISAWYPYALSGLPEGVDYVLNISLDQHQVSDFLFKPNYVHEVEPNQKPVTEPYGQDIDAAENFFVFPDAEIGNTHLTPTGRITDGTPYVRIKGTGDYTDDYYRFVINSDMLDGSADDEISVSNGINRDAAETYYDSATLTLNSTEVRDGDQWTIYIDGRTFATDGQAYSYLASTGDTLDDVVSGLNDVIAETTNTRFTLSASGSSLMIEQTDAGFYLGDATHKYGITQKRNSAATVTRTTTTRNKANDSDVELTAATIKLQGTPVVGEIWTISIGSNVNPHTVTNGQSLNDVANSMTALLQSNAAATVERSTDGSSQVLKLTAITGTSATISVSISGATPTGVAEIHGTPKASDEATTPWYEVEYDLTGDVGKKETWTLQINTSAYTVVANDYHSLDEMADLLDAAVGNAFGVEHANGKLTISNAVSFTSQLSIIQYTLNTATELAATAHSATVLLDHEVIEGDIWSTEFMFTDGSVSPSAYSTTVLASDATLSTSTEKLNAVADRLVTKINADAVYNFIAYNDDGILVLTHPTKTFSTLATVDQSSKITDNNVIETSVIEFNDDLLNGETWTFTLTNSDTDNSRTYIINSTTVDETAFATTVANA
ncbi:MAG: hypothetical protein HOJ62_17495, partial [Planctomycetaceae bacterium]|nr:hypothetical protein [Planctomycetaceae bacterium]